MLSVKTRKVKNRAATALRIAAQSLYRSQSYLGHYFRRMRAKLGAPKAITTAAHKLARIIYHIGAHGNLKRLTTGNQKWNLKDSCSWRAGFAAFGRPKNVELWMPT